MDKITKKDLYLKAIEIALLTTYQKTGINQVKDEGAVEAIETVYRHLTKAIGKRGKADKSRLDRDSQPRS